MAALRVSLTERDWAHAIGLATGLGVLWSLARLAGTGDPRYAFWTFASLAGGGGFYLVVYRWTGLAHRRALRAFARRHGLGFVSGPAEAARLPLLRALARHYDADTLYWKVEGPGPAALGPVLDGRAVLLVRVPWAPEYDRTAPAVTRVALFGKAAAEPVRVFLRRGFHRSRLGDQVLDRVAAGDAAFDGRFVVYARRPADVGQVLTQAVCDALAAGPPPGPDGLWIGPYGCAVHLPGRVTAGDLLDAWLAALRPLGEVLFRHAPPVAVPRQAECKT